MKNPSSSQQPRSQSSTQHYTAPAAGCSQETQDESDDDSGGGPLICSICIESVADPKEDSLRCLSNRKAKNFMNFVDVSISFTIASSMLFPGFGRKLQRIEILSHNSSTIHRCGAVSHIVCLANLFTAREGGDRIVPMSGKCPVCDLQCLWGDLIRFIHSFP